MTDSVLLGANADSLKYDHVKLLQRCDIKNLKYRFSNECLSFINQLDPSGFEKSFLKNSDTGVKN